MNQPSTRAGLVSALVAAVVGALVGAGAWWALTAATGYKFGLAGVGVGALAGLFANRVGGGSVQLAVPVAVVGLLGAVLGDVVSDAHLTTRGAASGAATTTLLKDMVEHPTSAGWTIYKEFFSVFDLLFYVFATLAAYWLATVPLGRAASETSATEPAVPGEPPAPAVLTAPATWDPALALALAPAPVADEVPQPSDDLALDRQPGLSPGEHAATDVLGGDALLEQPVDGLGRPSADPADDR